MLSSFVYQPPRLPPLTITPLSSIVNIEYDLVKETDVLSPAARIMEIDCIRGIAIILMVIFHTVFDLAYFYNWPIDYLQGFWYYQGKAAAILFMLISGISTTLSRSSMRRGLTVFGAGMLITAATYYYNPTMYIQFGILHLLGFSMFIAPWTTRLPVLLLTSTAIIFLLAGNVVADLTTASPWLLPLGIKPVNFASLDYYPLLPYLGIIFFGIAIGKMLYSSKQSLWPSALTNNFACGLRYLGRHSLLIYLIHQPILLAILFLFLS
ncbi:MAG: hypothetical protein H6Q72_259 [Firmicutes bacterium]|nr:hypothetical protein [Bacillota bacterium]